MSATITSPATTSTSGATSPVLTRTHQMVFLNLPVADVQRSREFFTALGYGFNEEMCNGEGLALELGPNHYAMLLASDFFDRFHSGQRVAVGQHEILTCLSAESRDEVDDVVDRALEVGASSLRTEESGDFMYGRSFVDLDSHIWEIMWMDLEKARAANVFG